MRTRKSIKAAAAGDRKLVALCGEVNVIQAEEGAEGKKGPARFNMEVYTGGAMVLEGYELPVVVDLAGMGRRNSLKANLDHVRSQRVGDVQDYQNDGKHLLLSGLCNAASKSRDEVVQSAADGYKWQASIEAADHARERVAKGKTVQVNGQTFTGPIIVVRKSTLTGFAFVSHGADDMTSGTIAAGSANNPEQRDMDKELQKFIEAQGFDPATLSDTQIKHFQASFEASRKGGSEFSSVAAAIEAEAAKQERLNKIKDLAIAAIKQYPKKAEGIQAMAREAEANEMSAKDFELSLLRSTIRPNSDAFLPQSGVTGLDNNVLTAALCKNAGLRDYDKVFDERVLDAADAHFRNGLYLSDLLMMAAKERGHVVTSRHDIEALLQGAFPDRRELKAAGWSGVSLSVVFSNVANKFAAKGFMAVDQSWRSIATIGSATNFQEMKRAAVTGDMSFQPLGPSGEIQHGRLGEVSYSNQVDTKALMLILQRKDIVNDDIGALTSQSTRLGRGGATGFNRDFWTEFLADHATFFPTDGSKKNYFEGAGTALSSSQLGVAVQKFLEQVDVDGLPLGVEPKVLLVCPTDKVMADELYQSTNNNTGGSSTKDKVPNKNTHAGKYMPVCSPYLANSAMGGAYSSTAFYLLSDPEELPFIEAAFLNGNQTPTLSSADADFENMGIKIKGFWDYGVRKQEYRAAVKSKGAS